MDSIADAQRAVDQLNGTNLHGRQIRVDFSATQRAHAPTPGEYRGQARPQSEWAVQPKPHELGSLQAVDDRYQPDRQYRRNFHEGHMYDDRRGGGYGGYGGGRDADRDSRYPRERDAPRRDYGYERDDRDTYRRR
jgi:transformer-2 protein